MVFDRPGCMSAGGRRKNGDITEIQGISARKIGQDQGRHVKKSRITTVYTVQRSFINRVTAQFMSRKNMTVLFLASCLAIQVHDITNHICFLPGTLQFYTKLLSLFSRPFETLFTYGRGKKISSNCHDQTLCILQQYICADLPTNYGRLVRK